MPGCYIGEVVKTFAVWAPRQKMSGPRTQTRFFTSKYDLQLNYGATMHRTSIIVTTYDCLTDFLFFVN
jgi:hypothetical protein